MIEEKFSDIKRLEVFNKAIIFFRMILNKRMIK